MWKNPNLNIHKARRLNTTYLPSSSSPEHQSPSPSPAPFIFKSIPLSHTPSLDSLPTFLPHTTTSSAVDHKFPLLGLARPTLRPPRRALAGTAAYRYFAGRRIHLPTSLLPNSERWHEKAGWYKVFLGVGVGMQGLDPRTCVTEY